MPKGTKAIKITDIKAEKPWLRKVGIYKYPIESIEKNKRFLIVCEGQTEELYFKSFPVLTANVKPVHLGCSKSILVECTKAYTEDEDYDEVWCVFDMDFTPGKNGQLDDFNSAIDMALESGYKCAYSNDAFELWFVLHYEYIDQEQERTFFFTVLSAKWEINYEKYGKTRDFAKSIYSKLINDNKASQERAIENARKLYEGKKDRVYHLQNPVTKVFELVELLNQHLRK